MKFHVHVAWRSLRRTPAFTTGVTLTLGVSLAGTVLVLHLTRELLWGPLPVPADERPLIALSLEQEGRPTGFSWPLLRDWRERSQAFDAIGAYDFTTRVVRTDQGAFRIDGAEVTGGLLPMLGAVPMLGEGFAEAHDRFGAERVVLLAAQLWRSLFESDSGLVGASVMLSDVPYRVLGVMPDGVAFPRTAQFWVPLLQSEEMQRPDWFEIEAVGRLRADADLEAARAEAAAIVATWPAARVTVRPFRSLFIPSGVTLQARALAAAVLVLLLLALVNTSALFLARAQARRQDYAVRSALGARALDHLSQWIAEGALLGGLGGALAATLVFVTQGIVLPSLPGGTLVLSRLGPVQGIAMLLGAALVAAGLGGLHGYLFTRGVVPAGVLRDVWYGTADRGAVRARGRFLAGQISLCLILLVSAGLMARSLYNVARVDPGFQPGNLVTATYALSGDAWANEDDRREAQGRIIRAMNSLPGVTAAAAAIRVPLVSAPLPAPVWGVTDQPLAASFNAVSQGYFGTMGIALQQGRDFSAEEATRPDGRVAIVSAALARQLWGERSALGQRIRLGEVGSVSAEEPGAEWLEVVGVASDVRDDELTVGARPGVYVPYGSWPAWYAGLVLRTPELPARIIPRVRNALQEIAPNTPVYRELRLTAAIDASLHPQRMLGVLVIAFAIAATGVVAAGVFGLVAYIARLGRRDIAIRLALGGGVHRISAHYLYRLSGTVWAGVGLGALGAALAGRGLRSQLYGVAPWDGVVFAAATLILVLVIAITAWLPLRTVARISLSRVLQGE